MNPPKIKRPDLASNELARKLIASFPKATPSWVVEEFSLFPKLVSSSELHAVIRSPHITPEFWARLERSEDERSRSSAVVTAAPSKLQPLGEFLRRASGYVAEKRLTKKERRATAERIKKLATELGRELDRLRDQHAYPDWRVASGDIRIALRESLFGEVERTLQPEHDELSAWIKGAASVLCRPDIVLRGIHDTASQWETPSGVVVHKPTKDSAARTYFIGVLERGFRNRYGQSMPDLIDPLVAALFEQLPTLDKADITKRLPTRRGRTKREK